MQAGLSYHTYGLLQNGTESLNLEQNISYGTYTEGQDDDYVLVSNGYGTTVRKVTLSSNQDGDMFKTECFNYEN